MELVSGKSRVGRHYLENQKNFRLNTGRSCHNLVTSMAQPWGTEDRYARRAGWFHPDIVFKVTDVDDLEWWSRWWRWWKAYRWGGDRWGGDCVIGRSDTYGDPDCDMTFFMLVRNIRFHGWWLATHQRGWTAPNPQPPHPQPDAWIHSVPLDGDLKNLNLCPL